MAVSVRGASGVSTPRRRLQVVAYESDERPSGLFEPGRMTSERDGLEVALGFGRVLEGIDELGVDRWVRAAAVVISDQDFDVVAFRESTETGQGIVRRTSLDFGNRVVVTVSIGMRRTRYQGGFHEPTCLPSYVFPLAPGDSLRRLPRGLLSLVAPVNGSWRVSDNFVVESLFNMRGGCTLLRGRGRIGLAGVWGSVGNVDLGVRDVDIPTPESRHATHVGMPPSWLFGMSLRHAVMFQDHPEQDGGCRACRVVGRWFGMYDEWLQNEWDRCADMGHQSGTAVRNERSFLVLVHSRECPYSRPPPFKRPVFFGPMFSVCARGDMGWIIDVEVDITLCVPGNFLEREWSAMVVLDLVFPLDRLLHGWLGSFVRVCGELRMRGLRASRRAPIYFD